MLRLAKLDTGEPAFFLLCDHRNCMEARRGGAVAAKEDYRAAKTAFLQTAISEGWWIDLEGVFCPPHAREMLRMAEEAEKRGSRIVQAQGAQIAAFSRHL
jgi:hypothetical protein